MSESNNCPESVNNSMTHCVDEASRCFQCLKCTSGCPMASSMDVAPARLMRLLQLGEVDRALATESYWLCAGCLTCSTRCPNQIDIAHIMDRLRQEAMQRGIFCPRKKIASFHAGFLKSVKRHGRNFETGLLAGYALKNNELFKNAGLGMAMFSMGKMPMKPTKVSNRQAIRKLFDQKDAKNKED